MCNRYIVYICKYTKGRDGMKSLESYLNLPFTLHIAFDGSRYTASITEFDDCSGSAETLEEAVALAVEKRKQLLEKAIEACIELLAA